jgi:hypothetical protein
MIGMRRPALASWVLPILVPTGGWTIARGAVGPALERLQAACVLRSDRVRFLASVGEAFPGPGRPARAEPPLPPLLARHLDVLSARRARATAPLDLGRPADAAREVRERLRHVGAIASLTSLGGAFPRDPGAAPRAARATTDRALGEAQLGRAERDTQDALALALPAALVGAGATGRSPC